MRHYKCLREIRNRRAVNYCKTDIHIVHGCTWIYGGSHLPTNSESCSYTVRGRVWRKKKVLHNYVTLYYHSHFVSSLFWLFQNDPFIFYHTCSYSVFIVPSRGNIYVTFTVVFLPLGECTMALYKHVRVEILYQLIKTFPFILLPLFTKEQKKKGNERKKWRKR